MKRSIFHIVLLCVGIIPTLISCEKEITVDLPPGKQSIVVEASINQLFPNLNYIFVTRTLDYFNPDISLFGIENASITITPGTIVGADTLFDPNDRIPFPSATSLNGDSQLIEGISGIYVNPLFRPSAGVPYLLEISVDGETITGITTIPQPISFDSLYYRKEINPKDTAMYLSFEFTDRPEQNNYRLMIYKNANPILPAWGSVDISRLFDDTYFNDMKTPYNFLNPFKFSDTLNIYFTTIGREEFLFWQSYRKAASNGGPYATPLNVRSNIKGAIGSFTGYGITYRRLILQ